MKLSMWMLADWLKKYSPVVKIEEGAQVLRSARILSSDMRIEPQNVYLAPAGEFISGEKDRVLCVQGHDMLLLDTTDMDSVLNDIFDAFDHYNRWADGLLQDIEDGCDLQHLLDASHAVFGEPLAVFDAGHMLIAHSGQYGPGSVDAEWDVMLQTGNNSLDILEKMREHLHRSRSCHQVQELNFPFFSMYSMQRMLFHGQTVIGQIILLEFHRREGAGVRQLLDTLGGLLERWMEHSREQRLLQAESEIFQRLLDRRPVSAGELDHKLAVMGWEKEHEKLLLRIRILEEYREITHPLRAKLERVFPDCVVFLRQEEIYILADLFFTPWETLERELRALLKNSAFYCGVSYPFRDVLQLAVPDGQCSLTLGFASGRRGGIFLCRDHALDYLRSTLCTYADPAAIHPALRILRESDERNHSDLYRTLYVYLTNNCNLAHTAQLLNLHRNSLMYRLNKIQSMAELDLGDSRLREHLYLSYVAADGIS